MDVIEEIRNHLSIFKNMYDLIRVIDPNSKEAVLFDNDSNEISREQCIAFWDNETYCENCISARAYKEMSTLFKVEHKNDNIVFITATPTVIDGKTYVAELIKEIKISSRESNDDLQTSEINQLIYDINKKVIQNG